MNQPIKLADPGSLRAFNPTPEEMLANRMILASAANLNKKKQIVGAAGLVGANILASAKAAEYKTRLMRAIESLKTRNNGALPDEGAVLREMAALEPINQQVPQVNEGDRESVDDSPNEVEAVQEEDGMQSQASVKQVPIENDYQPQKVTPQNSNVGQNPSVTKPNSKGFDGAGSKPIMKEPLVQRNSPPSTQEGSSGTTLPHQTNARGQQPVPQKSVVSSNTPRVSSQAVKEAQAARTAGQAAKTAASASAKKAAPGAGEALVAAQQIEAVKKAFKEKGLSGGVKALIDSGASIAYAFCVDPAVIAFYGISLIPAFLLGNFLLLRSLFGANNSALTVFDKVIILGLDIFFLFLFFGALVFIIVVACTAQGGC